MGETLAAIISAECQTAALVAGTIATTISSNLLDKRSPRVGAIIFGLLIGFAALLPRYTEEQFLDVSESVLCWREVLKLFGVQQSSGQ
jgi:fructose-specific phosphotransferase system IIC component